MTKEQGGYRATHISLLNGRLFQHLLAQEPEALYTGEQGKILHCLWLHGGRGTATDIAIHTGLANNTLTSMLKRLEEQGLIVQQPCPNDKRKKIWHLTDKGWGQEVIGKRVSERLSKVFYEGFSEEEIAAFESYQERILANLKANLQRRKIDEADEGC
ncbi:MarR family winged helix-turn-helix transcriptional regulator [Streptococcus ovuberis]|uniref:MarR family transcriptional regulator n=1 Tax=Streptococcus ovuberis TaxID=1936207 RepID=A0A7X6MZJ0_9STRE|nr:MarR family transcriptional regulator [Streptococcus ovuberis]NKZ20736.1 MarR family transcriptional regulator [Streptococcus ovuberis]